MKIIISFVSFCVITAHEYNPPGTSGTMTPHFGECVAENRHISGDADVST